MENFLFYGNKPYSTSDGILMSNKDSIDQFTFKNCQFDQTRDEVKSLLYQHSETGGAFEVNIGPGQGQTYTFEYAYSYTKPSQCIVPEDVLNFGTNFFTESKTFSPSMIFTKSSFFVAIVSAAAKAGTDWKGIKTMKATGKQRRCRVLLPAVMACTVLLSACGGMQADALELVRFPVEKKAPVGVKAEISDTDFNLVNLT